MSFMSIQDMIANSISTLPVSITFVAISICMSHFNINKNSIYSAEKGGEGDTAVSPFEIMFARIIGVFSLKITSIVFAASFLLSLFTSTWPLWVFLSSVPLFISIMNAFSQNGMYSRIKYLPPLLMFCMYSFMSFISGVSEAAQLRYLVPKHHLTTLSGEEYVTVLRQTQDYLIVLRPDFTMAAISSSQVSEIERVATVNARPMFSMDDGAVQTFFVRSWKWLRGDLDKVSSE